MNVYDSGGALSYSERAMGCVSGGPKSARYERRLSMGRNKRSAQPLLDGVEGHLRPAGECTIIMLPISRPRSTKAAAAGLASRFHASGVASSEA